MPGKRGAAADDADLADLLPPDNGGADSERIPLTKSLDALAGAKSSSSSRQAGGGLCTLISAHLSYLCFAYPTACGCFACIMMFVCVSALAAEMVNPTQKFGEVPHDWTTVSSIYELDAGKIDHWCLGGGNEGCRCEDPLVPTSRAELRAWTEAYKDNKRMIDKYLDDPLVMAELDVAIVGESAVEEMDGRWLGRFRNDELKNIGTIFHNHFNKEKGAPVEGVALGIAGDSAGNVLWRLIHGEMANGFEPKIWWVSLGMNDLTRQQCSEEVVVLGVLRVVEEILKRRPRSRIVINSLLPMADLRGGTVVTEKDYRDAFSTYRGKRDPRATTHYVRQQVDGKEKFVQVPRPPGPHRRTSSSSSSDENRQLLEAALEAYSARNNDNSDEIDRLQRKLQEQILGIARSSEDPGAAAAEDFDNMIERRLEQNQDIPRVAKRDRYNPTLDRGRHEQRKYNFFRKRRMPLWTSIYAINKQLFKFCEKHDRVDFFDATNIFAERKSDVGQKYFTLLSDNISARGHPTPLGFLKWEDAMVKKIQQILEEMKKEQPEMFLKVPQGPGLGSDEFKAMERVEKKPFIDDKRGDEMETQVHKVEPDEEETVDEAHTAGGDEEEEDDEGEGEDEEVGNVQQQMMQPGGMQQNSMMSQQGMPQNSMMMQQQPGMPQNGMMQRPGMPQGNFYPQQTQQQGSMMMQQQQPGMPQGGMMQQGMPQGGMRQQPGMQQANVYPQQPGSQNMPQSGMMQQPGMQQGNFYPQQPSSQRDGIMQPGTEEDGMMPPGTPQDGMMQPGTPQDGMMQPDMQQDRMSIRPGMQEGGYSQMQQRPTQGNYQPNYQTGQVEQPQQLGGYNQMEQMPMQGMQGMQGGMQGMQGGMQGMQGSEGFQGQGMVQGGPDADVADDEDDEDGSQEEDDEDDENDEDDEQDDPKIDPDDGDIGDEDEDVDVEESDGEGEEGDAEEFDNGEEEGENEDVEESDGEVEEGDGEEFDDGEEEGESEDGDGNSDSDDDEEE